MMTNDVLIDTGMPRSVTGHVVSGSLAAATVAGALNYNRYVKGEISQKQAWSNSLKLTAQGGIATGSAIAAANHLGSGNIVGMLTAVSIGAMGVYAVEKMSDTIEQNAKEFIENEGE
jgi:Na+/alanine symporter